MSGHRHLRARSRRPAAAVASVALAALALVVAPPVQATTPAPQTYAQAFLDKLPLEVQVGQVLMAGSPATRADGATIAAIRNQHVGSVILTGRSTAGVAATAGVSAALERANPEAARLFVAADQEGGQVQVLRGPGFSTMPTALTQGQQAPGALRGNAGEWGSQLRRAGVNVNLAPVLGTVPSLDAARNNPPIGAFDREYGYDPDAVAAHGTAFAQGMADAGVDATIKHFPGLGRVTANTDVSAGVTDTVTTRNDPYLQPFAIAVRAGAPMLMMSTAVYSRIDPNHPAALSPTIIGGMVRGDLGFTGVVVSDDLGNARQVAFLSPGDRAVRFLAAGGDLVLNVDPATIPAMYEAVLGRSRVDAGFRARVRDAALHVLAAKAARGLLPAPGVNTFYLAATAGGPAGPGIPFGQRGDRPIQCDFDNNGTDTIGVVRGVTWYFRNHNAPGASAGSFSFGNPGDQPVCGKLDGTHSYFGVYRSGVMYLRRSPTDGPVQVTLYFGSAGDTAVLGDWDGNGTQTPGVFRNGNWYLANGNRSGGLRTDGQFSFGQAGDRPVVGDWNGDPFTTTGVVRNGIWYLTNSNIVPTESQRFSFGNRGDLPVAGTFSPGRRSGVGVARQ
ncbi:MAG: glycoside hydrolase family 3 N-terminal domain-containing protein [Mycobacteriaceae bacterium]